MLLKEHRGRPESAGGGGKRARDDLAGFPSRLERASLDFAAQRIEQLVSGLRDAATDHDDLGIEDIDETGHGRAEERCGFPHDLERETAALLGAAVAGFINIFNPEVVVICGGVTQAGDKLFNPLRSEVKRRAFKPAWEACKIVPGTLPATAGGFGAAAVFLQKHWGLR